MTPRTAFSSPSSARRLLDASEQAGVLLFDLVALEAGELLEPQVEDGLRLRACELEGVHERVARRLAVGSVADDADDLVEIVKGDEQAFEDVGPRLGLVQLELGPPDDDLFLEGDVRLDHLGEVERAGHAADQRDVDDPESRLHLGVLVELVEHDHRDGLALELDDQPHTRAIRLVAQVADLGDLLGLHEIDDVVDQRGAVDLVRQLRDDDGAPVALELLGVRLGADADAAAAGAVGLFEPAGAEDHAAGREVRPLDELHQVVGGGLRVVDHVQGGVDDLTEVVRRNVGGHADGDAGRAVDEQVRHAAGQDLGLAPRLVVVGHPVDGIGVDVAHHLNGDLAEARLRVAHGRRRVALDGAEVALTVDQRVAHVEVLRHAHESRVDDGLAVGVVVAARVAGDLGALAVLLVGGEAEVVHSDQDAPLAGLEAVAHVGKGAVGEHAHRIVDERRAHLVFELDGLDLAFERLQGIRHRGTAPPSRSSR